MPAPAQISLKVIVIAHFILSVWASMTGAPFLPTAYIYMNAVILSFGIWGIVDPESSEAMFMYLIVNITSILMDVIFLGIFTPPAHAAFEGGVLHSRVNEYRFCLGMSIVNLIIKPFTSFVVYRLYQERGGQYGDLSTIPGFANFGVASGSEGRPSNRGYENIDQAVESAAPHEYKPPPSGAP